nr:sugar kinase [Tessaracoccus sp. MC1756]
MEQRDSRRVICAGETMLVLSSVDEPPFEPGGQCRVALAGAESNVALMLTQLGVKTDWLSVLSDDRLGDIIRRTLESRGVNVLARELGAQTGVILRAPRGHNPRNYYFRDGSAASHLEPNDAEALDWTNVALVHTTGITAGLSGSAQDFTRRLMELGREHNALVSFDLNHRRALTSRRTGPVLLDLANRSDVFFAGRDEILELFGVEGDANIRALFPSPDLLVLKNGAQPVSVLGRESPPFEAGPVPIETIVDEIGAGDAFAGGFLSGLLEGASVPESLRRATEAAALTLRGHDDTPILKPEDVRRVRGERS